MANTGVAGPITVGSGSDLILVNVSEDAYNGDAQFVLSVDGVQIGDVQTATASHALAEQQSFLVNGSFGVGTHVLGVNFLNDAYGGTSDADRNLYVDQVISGGVIYPPASPLYSSGLRTVSVNVPAQPVTIGAGADTIVLHVAEDAYQGDAQFTVSVDGTQIGGVQTATTLHSSGQEQLFNVLGDFGTGPLSLTVNFLNDAYGGAPDADRNLYVNRIDRGGVNSNVNQRLFVGGPLTFSLGVVPVPRGPVTIGSGPDSIVLGISENAYQGDARFTVSVDGVQVGDVQTATAAHQFFQTQAFTVLGSFGAGPHNVAVEFLNDAYGGTALTDRNLWVDSVAYAGLSTFVPTPLFSNGTATFNVQPPVTVINGSDITGPAGGHAVLNGTAGDDTIVARGAGNAVNGNGGSDTVTGGEAGGDTIVLGTIRDGLTAPRDTVVISGFGNFVSAGDGTNSLSGAASGSIAKLGNGANTVSLDGPGNNVEVGTGANVVSATGGDATVRITGFLGGPQQYSDAVTISEERNTVAAQVNQGKYSAPGNLTINGGTGFGTFNFGAGTGTLNTGGPGNFVGFGGGVFDIPPGSGSATVSSNGFPALSVGTIHLAGLNNVVRGSGALLTVDGGDGSGTYEFLNNGLTTNKASSVDTNGPGNTVTQRGTDVTMHLNGGNDTVSVFGGRSSVVFSGSGDMLFVHPGQPFSSGAGGAAVSVLDKSAGLQVSLDPGFGSLDISGFDPTGVFHLLGGIGGFTTPDQAAAAVVYDKTGFNTLLLGSDRIVFTGVALTADRFTIG